MSDVGISETLYQRALRLVEEHVARLDRYWKVCASGGALGAVNVIRGKHRNLENILKVVDRNVRTLHVLDRQKLRNLITESSWREESYNRINGLPDDAPDLFAVHLETLERDFIRRWENIARRERARGKDRSVRNPSSSRRRAKNPVEAAADAQIGVAIALLRRRRELDATIGLLKLIDLPEPHRLGGFVWFNKKNREATEWGDNGDSFWAHHYQLPVGHQYPSILIELEACGCREAFFGVFYSDEEAVEALNAVGIYEEL
jgi:hypothetical protein